MRPNLQEKGQALILIAFAAVGLFAFAALAIDGSRVFSDRRHAQNAADTAVLAAALAKVRGGDYSAAAITRAASNGYTNDADSIVEVHLCSETGIVCQGLPAGADPSEFIQVKIISTIPTTFARVLGRQSVTSAVEAVARVQGSSATGSFPADAVVALDDSNTECIICGGGNVKFEVHNSGVFSNGTSVDCNNKKSSITLWTNFQPYAEKGFTTPSTDPQSFCLRGITEAPGSGGFHTGAKLNPTYNVPQPPITCAGPAAADSGNPHAPGGAVVHQGWHYGNYNLSSGTYTFEPGNHCFDTGLTILADDVTADNVNFLVQAGGLKINTNGIFSSNNMIVSADGGVEIGGGGNITCTGVTFYVNSGVFKTTGNPNMTLTASTSDPYKGLLVYLPKDSNTSDVHVGGTSNIQLTGSIIAPGSQVTLIGTSNSNGFDTQVVGKTIKLDGTADVIIKFNPANQYNPPAAPTIQLTE